MNRLGGIVVAAIAVMGLLVSGCQTTGSAPTSANAPASSAATAAPSTAAKPAAAPTSVPAAQPTMTAAKKIDYPAKGKSITMIVPWPAGGLTDLGARMLAPALEKELGVPIQIVNKAGAGSQVGLTELATSKPDGYTLSYMNLPQAITCYLDPERKATFGRRDLQAVAMHGIEPGTVAVAANSPYKTMKDLVEAAKANPEKLKAGDSGILGMGHLQALQVQKMTGAKFAIVHFEGGAQSMTALIGGHIDAVFSNLGDNIPQLVQNGQIRVLGIADSQESKFLAGAPTMESQGYKYKSFVTVGVVAPPGTPKEIVETISSAMKKVADSDDHKKKMSDTGRTLRYLNTSEYEGFWNEYEAEITQLIPLVSTK